VVVAAGDPGTPVVWTCALADGAAAINATENTAPSIRQLFGFTGQYSL